MSFLLQQNLVAQFWFSNFSLILVNCTSYCLLEYSKLIFPINSIFVIFIIFLSFLLDVSWCFCFLQSSCCCLLQSPHSWIHHPPNTQYKCVLTWRLHHKNTMWAKCAKLYLLSGEKLEHYWGWFEVLGFWSVEVRMSAVIVGDGVIAEAQDTHPRYTGMFWKYLG